MPDIELRFNRDMLVLSAPADALLARQGINASRDRHYLNLLEPDVMIDALRMETMAGAHCLTTPTEDITSARLAHLNMQGDTARLAQAALDIAAELKPQHVLVEIGPCGLPLDASSKASLNENRGQYADAARAFGDGAFDAFLLTGFTSIADLKCAMMGVAQVSGKPVFASVTIGAHVEPAANAARQPAGVAAREDFDSIKGIASSYPFAAEGFEVLNDAPAPPIPAARRTVLDPSSWPEAIDTMVDLSASVVGFETADSITRAVQYAQTAVQHTQLPVLAQLCVPAAPAKDVRTSKGLTPLNDIDEYTPDTMGPAAVKLYAAGVQFLRATGAATPAFTGALAATVQGLDVRRQPTNL